MWNSEIKAGQRSPNQYADTAQHILYTTVSGVVLAMVRRCFVPFNMDSMSIILYYTKISEGIRHVTTILSKVSQYDDVTEFYEPDEE